MIGRIVAKLNSLSQVQKCFFARKTIIDLKEYRQKQSNETTNSFNQQSQQGDFANVRSQLHENKIQKEQFDYQNKYNQEDSQQYKQTRSKQLASQILKCSSDSELIKIYQKSKYPLESQHYAMLLYKFTEIYKYQQQYDREVLKQNKLKEEENSAKIEKRYSLSEKKMFLQILEKVNLNLEEMNPDSLNLLLKMLGKMADDYKNKEIVSQLFNNIIQLLEKDQNINFFSEIQIYHFILYLNILKKEINSSKSAQKVIVLAVKKLCNHLKSLRRSQLLQLMYISMHLEITEPLFHQKLISAILQKPQFLSALDFTILFQYNSLFYQKQLSKNYSKESEQQKNDISNRILYHMLKHKFTQANFKCLAKICGFIYKMDIKLDQQEVLNSKIEELFGQSIENYIKQQQDSPKQSSHPILLNDCLNYILANPKIYIKNFQLFVNINSYLTKFDQFDFQNVLHITNFLVECLIRDLSGKEEYKFQEQELAYVIQQALAQPLQNINKNFQKAEYYNLEELFELIQKIEKLNKIKNIIPMDEVQQIFNKSLKYICQITHKLSTPVIIKIGFLLKNILQDKEKEQIILQKQLKKYPFRIEFENFETASEMQEAKQFFMSIQKQVDLNDLMKEDKPEKSIEELDFTEDLERIQEQIYKEATEKQEELMKIKMSHEELQIQFAPLQVPSIKQLKKNEDNKYDHLKKYLDIFRKNSICINAILLSQIVFSDDQLKLQDQDIWKISEKCFYNSFIPQLLSIDNVNSIIFSQAIYKLNEMQFLQSNDSLNQVVDLRVQNVLANLQQMKQNKLKNLISLLEIKYKKTAKIETNQIQLNNIIDILVTLSNNDKIAAVYGFKNNDENDSGKPFDSKDEGKQYFNKLKQQILIQSGFKEVYLIDSQKKVFIDMQ
ncbi:hypothetical protein TTHERM_00566860 (macronuclear) [Tetrahymena thermophila SB210]|uniref:Uncharacterized protein n=1 Tax=Tetrahymena thermophila (strain SB210) TaxID=312017 RepID=I7M309_TETTS|nr:hypothetical protein TTHERM_00566860 [Tetrahymena thermophila SB210]EAS01842.2 hypothetical protein TTHERM_00566860 [Tetrahymena thermophila SB210]|eukprot:XP_001022087.2 hypothetical protein TTHERM_00566860 [Tetrahymena thermophila SB210]